MRLILVALAALAAALILNVRPSFAQNYPWCANYSVPGGAVNCGFVSYEQCMATVSGIGGFCRQNAMYVPPVRATVGYAPRKHRAKRHHVR